MGSRKKFMAVAIEAAEKAGRILLSSYGKLKKSDISTKSKNDFVTQIDKKSERLIISTIKKNFPHHAIQGEESGSSLGSEALWIIDPLDGTANYIHQFPLFSISIAVVNKVSTLAGVVFDPLHGELFRAEKGKGAYLNKKRIHVSNVPSLSQSLMATGFPFRARVRFEEYLKSFETITLASAGMRRGGSAALDLAYVACGRFDGFWELDLSPWDIAAGALLIEEAGGQVTSLWGKTDYLKHGDILASNGEIHETLKRVTSKIFTPVNQDKRCRWN